MIERIPRFAGLAAAAATFVASTLATSPLASAQGARARTAAGSGLREAAMPSGVTGVVRDRIGRPQIGAVVELLDARYSVVAHTFTDDRGRYSLPRLGPGMYQVKASNALFLPTVRPDLKLLANSRVIVNLTLSTLYQALQWLPTEPRNAGSTNDDWNWTLRLSANRPLLRMLAPSDGLAAAQLANRAQDGDAQGPLDGPVLIQSADAGAGSQNRRVAVHSGLRRFGQGGLDQQVGWRSSGGESRALAFEAKTASGSAVPSAHASSAVAFANFTGTAVYRQELSPDRSMLTVVSVAERPGIGDGTASGLATARVRSASTVHLGDLARLSIGTELEAVRLGGRAITAGGHPFGALQVQAGDTLVRYSVATAPGMADAAQMEAEAEEDAPALTEVDGKLAMEQGLHQELSLSRTVRSWTGQVGVFHDRLAHPVVEGSLHGDEAALDSNDVLYDPVTGTIAVSGRGYSGGGVLAMLHDQLSPDTWVSLRYALGEAVTMPGAGSPAFAQSIGDSAAQQTAHASSMAAVAAGTRLAATGTVIRGSYRWQPVGTLTQVAPFDADTPDAYLGLSVRQPLHLHRIGPGQVEAIVDVRNLLAQGYQPFVSKDGSTVYFAQSQRSIAAGLAFSF